MTTDPALPSAPVTSRGQAPEPPTPRQFADGQEHGRKSTYLRGCRCRDCRAAKAEAARMDRQRLIELGQEDPSRIPHGTATGYGNWKCRCQPCKDAAAIARRTQRGAKPRLLALQVDETGPLTEQQVAEKFAGRFKVVGECWEAEGEAIAFGYIRLTLAAAAGQRRRALAHRLSLELTLGRPLQEYALHHCDNPPCFRLSHLYEGSPQQNSDDCVRRGRTSAGERNAKSKLSPQQVLALRADRAAGMSFRQLAAKYGISHQAARSIALRQAWRSV